MMGTEIANALYSALDIVHFVGETMSLQPPACALKGYNTNR